MNQLTAAMMRENRDESKWTAKELQTLPKQEQCAGSARAADFRQSLAPRVAAKRNHEPGVHSLAVSHGTREKSVCSAAAAGAATREAES